MRKKQIMKILGVVIVGVVFAGMLFYSGFRFGIAAHIIEQNSAAQLPRANFALFWDAINVIKDKFVNIKGVTDQDLLYGAIKGSLGSLNDPYSSFFPPSDAKKFNEDLSGSFGGVGAEIGIHGGQLVIISPIKGNPAEAAGLKAGDQILKIDDTATMDLSVDDAVKIIRGEVGTTVTLTIFREGWKAPKDFKITRAVISEPTIDFAMKGDIAYFRIYGFNASAPELFYSAAMKASFQSPKGIIVDVRNDPGGFLEAAENIASWFLKRGDPIVIEQFRSGDRAVSRANGNSAFANIPVVVLTNEGSASASEILAGALRDKRNAKLIGAKTFGKGSVQEVDYLSDNSSVKITIAKWLTPNGSEIDKKGLSPDVAVPMTDDDVLRGKDPQLDKALEIIHSLAK